jgi:hypothetical protein
MPTENFYLSPYRIIHHDEQQVKGFKKVCGSKSVLFQKHESSQS